MTMFVFGALVGGLAGLARGGSLANLAGLRLPRIGMVWGAALVQLSLYLVPEGIRDDIAAAAVLGSTGLVGWWLLVVGRTLPRLRHGLVITSAGLYLNALVILLNGAMPVSSDALRVAGVPADVSIEDGNLYKHEKLDAATVLPWLGDVIPLPMPWGLSKAVSLGDLVLVLGLGLIFYRLTAPEQEYRRELYEPKLSRSRVDERR